ncbi:1-acyl-sn-glycerol-3-phosphate acyltransferase [Terrilactibacillus sp. BCM23-1]|uniref:1-acyl-sn-glycerol-3-phosphate acyltransferase n=1 Tax=Terrilactibacillus tamarindi TaxID=2599694 RepID=A0A6N8CMH8_9BACI|nr:lysophospholipid acyltransferase family protein [Terrilactibacillus tamarindi]MTT31259.1 1-acyl-sn-glycerol-3-phosphate acyltransferase [Terrilactibacillus tamarindi]
MGKNFFHCLFRMVYRYEVVGVEHIPKDGGVLICSNHLSNFDPPLVGVSCPRDVSFLAKSEMFKFSLGRRILTKVHAFPIRRGAGDRHALKVAKKLLDEGHVLIMFPEGTRSKTGDFNPARPGVGFFALRTDAAVIPCYIKGNYKLFSRVKVYFGQPVDTSNFKENKAKPIEVAKYIMTKIEDLKERSV